MRVGLFTAAIILTTNISSFSAAAGPSIAIGTVAERSLGASVLYLQNPFQGIHFTLQKPSDTEVSTTIDFHQYFSVSGSKAAIGGWGHLASYIGLGVRNQSSTDGSDADSLSVRAPLGLELSLKDAPIQLLADATGELRLAQGWGMAVTPRIGFRAVF